MTQKERMLKALQRETLTTYQSIIRLGILCPWKRVQELRADGHQIASDFVTLDTRDGPRRIVRYRLERPFELESQK